MMRNIIIFLFVASIAYANYNYTGENGGKIDMHGGKSSSLVDKNKGFSNKPFSLQNDSLGSKMKHSNDTNNTK